MRTTTAPAHRFRPAQRILRSTDFVRVMREGKRYRHASFTLHYRPNRLGFARLGVAVGRRVSPRANRRNTIKRITRECFRVAAGALPPLDIVVLAHPDAARLQRGEYARALAGALSRLADPPSDRR